GVGQVEDIKRRLLMIVRGATPRRLSPAGRLFVLALLVLLPLGLVAAEPARPAAAEQAAADKADQVKAPPPVAQAGPMGTAAPAGDDEPIAFENRGQVLQQEAGEIWQVALSPDGKTLAAAYGIASERPGELKLWDVATGQSRSLFRDRHALRCVTFSPDGKLVAAGGFDNVVRLFEVEGGKLKAILRGHTGGVNGVAFSPDGKLLGSCSLDKTARLWDVAKALPVATLSWHKDWVLSLAFSPDGKSLVTGSRDKTVKIWDVATRKERLT